jgi:hypothetical protein
MIPLRLSPPKDRFSSTVIPRISSVSDNYGHQEFIPGSSTMTSLERSSTETEARTRPLDSQQPPSHTLLWDWVSHTLCLPREPRLRLLISPHSETLPITRVTAIPALRGQLFVRLKVSRRLRQDPPPEDSQDPRQRRRSRGLSLGPLHFAFEGKGKEREPESPAKSFIKKILFLASEKGLLEDTWPIQTRRNRSLLFQTLRLMEKDMSISNRPSPQCKHQRQKRRAWPHARTATHAKTQHLTSEPLEFPPAESL